MVEISVWHLSPLSLSRHLKARPRYITIWDSGVSLWWEGETDFCVWPYYTVMCFSSQGKALPFRTVLVLVSWQCFTVKSGKCLKSMKSLTHKKELSSCAPATTFASLSLCAWPAGTDGSACRVWTRQLAEYVHGSFEPHYQQISCKWDKT